MSLYGAADSFYRYCFDEEEKAFYMVMNDTSILVIKAEETPDGQMKIA